MHPCMYLHECSVYGQAAPPGAALNFRHTALLSPEGSANQLNTAVPWGGSPQPEPLGPKAAKSKAIWTGAWAPGALAAT